MQTKLIQQFIDLSNNTLDQKLSKENKLRIKKSYLQLNSISIPKIHSAKHERKPINLGKSKYI